MIETTSNQVARESFLTLHYRLCGPGGAVFLDTFAGKPATLSLGRGELTPAIEDCLIGMREGQRARFDLDAGVAFGARNPQLLQHVTRDAVRRVSAPDATVDVGDIVHFQTPDRTGSYAGVVTQLGAESLLVDFNHPLAGQTVSFEVQLIGVL
ncbi:MAG: FKBP-type peptidyl-prolyl cis-trans isomerase [Burkholderiaceae bacterium]